MNLCILGTKGAGKGTQVKRLIAKNNLVSFATGDLLRKGIKQKTALGRLAEKYVQNAELVPDDIVNGLVEEWLQTTSPQQGIIMDGFPRTRTQAAFLEEIFKNLGRTLDVVVFLDVKTDTVIQRLTPRRVCSLCSEEFHLESNPFKTCPSQKCAGEHLEQLHQDDPEVIQILVHDFQSSIERLLEYYEKTGRLVRISGENDPETVHASIVKAIAPFVRS